MSEKLTPQEQQIEKPLEAGDEVYVTRSDGSVEGGWKIKSINKEEDSVLVEAPFHDRSMVKTLSLSELQKIQEEFEDLALNGPFIEEGSPEEVSLEEPTLGNMDELEEISSPRIEESRGEVSKPKVVESSSGKREGENITFEQADKEFLEAVDRFASISPEHKKMVERAWKSAEKESQSEQLTQALEAIEEQNTKIEKEAEKRDALGIIKNIGEWYEKQPLSHKLGIAGVLLVGGLVAPGVAGYALTSMLATSRFLSGAGIAVALDAVLQKNVQNKGRERTKNERVRHAIEAISAGIVAGAFGGEVIGKALGGVGELYDASKEKATAAFEYLDERSALLKEELSNFLPNENAPSSQTPTPSETITQNPLSTNEFIEKPIVYEIQKGDSVWKIVEDYLQDNEEFQKLSADQKIYAIDALKDRFPDAETRVLQIGEKIDFGEILNTKSVEEALHGASHVPENFLEKNPPSLSVSEGVSEIAPSTNELLPQEEVYSVLDSVSKEDILENEVRSLFEYSGITTPENILTSAAWEALENEKVSDFLSFDFGNSSVFHLENGTQINVPQNLNSLALLSNTQELILALQNETGLKPSEGETISEYLSRGTQTIIETEEKNGYFFFDAREPISSLVDQTLVNIPEYAKENVLSHKTDGALFKIAFEYTDEGTVRGFNVFSTFENGGKEIMKEKALLPNWETFVKEGTEINKPFVEERARGLAMMKEVLDKMTLQGLQYTEEYSYLKEAVRKNAEDLTRTYGNILKQ